MFDSDTKPNPNPDPNPNPNPIWKAQYKAWSIAACTISSHMSIPTAAETTGQLAGGETNPNPYPNRDWDYRPADGGDLLRWTAHCAFGSIHRCPGEDRCSWTYTYTLTSTLNLKT